MDALTSLLTRKSVKPIELIEPGPTSEQLETILKIATRVPDHGKLTPWRIHIFDKKAQAKLGKIFRERWEELNLGVEGKILDFQEDLPQRAPLLLAVTTQFVEGKIPVFEQLMSAGNVCFNILHAAHALGLGACWLTEWPAYDTVVAKHLGCEGENKIVGFLYIGTAKSKPEDRPRPVLTDVVAMAN